MDADIDTQVAEWMATYQQLIEELSEANVENQKIFGEAEALMRSSLEGMMRRDWKQVRDCGVAYARAIDPPDNVDMPSDWYERKVSTDREVMRHLRAIGQYYIS